MKKGTRIICFIVICLLSVSCIFSSWADGIIQSTGLTGIAFDCSKETLCARLDEWLWSEPDLLFIHSSSDWVQQKQPISLISVLTGNYLKNNEQIYTRTYGVSKYLDGYEEGQLRLNPDDKDNIDLFDLLITTDETGHVLFVAVFPVINNVFDKLSSIGYTALYSGVFNKIPAKMLSILKNDTMEYALQVLSAAGMQAYSGQAYKGENILCFNGKFDDTPVILIGALKKQEVTEPVSTPQPQPVTEECDHDVQIEYDSEKHWAVCTKCGMIFEDSFEPHWRNCTEEKCAMCGQPYYDDNYYLEHTGTVSEARFMDNTQCLWVWSCCGREEIHEHCYPDYEEEIRFTAVDDQYHTYHCSMCHAEITEKHYFDSDGYCNDCGYSLNGYTPEKSLTENQNSNNSLRPGDNVFLGWYEQDNDKSNGPEPIEWTVLEVQGDKCLVISRYGLEHVAFHNDNSSLVTWENSKIRKWLNDDFFSSVFNRDEVPLILKTVVDNSPAQGDTEYRTNTDGGLTEDRLFLLSCAEVKKYYGIERKRDNRSAVMDATPHVKNEWATVYKPDSWWLRSIYESSRSALIINSSGRLIYSKVTENKNCIRPAFWMEISGKNIEDEAVSDLGRDSFVRESSVWMGRSFKRKREDFIKYVRNRLEEAGLSYLTDFWGNRWSLVEDKESQDKNTGLWTEGTRLYKSEHELYRNYMKGNILKLTALTDNDDYLTAVIYTSPSDYLLKTLISDQEIEKLDQDYRVLFPSACLMALTGETLESCEETIQNLRQEALAGNLPKDEENKYYLYNESIKITISFGYDGVVEYGFSVKYASGVTGPQRPEPTPVPTEVPVVAPSDETILKAAHACVDTRRSGVIRSAITARDNNNRFVVRINDGIEGYQYAIWLEFDYSGQYYNSFEGFYNAIGGSALNVGYGFLTTSQYEDLYQTNVDFRWGMRPWVYGNEEWCGFAVADSQVKCTMDLPDKLTYLKPSDGEKTVSENTALPTETAVPAEKPVITPTPVVVTSTPIATVTPTVTPTEVPPPVDIETEEIIITTEEPIQNVVTETEEQETEVQEENDLPQVLFCVKTKKATNIRETTNKNAGLITKIPKQGIKVDVLETLTGDDGKTWYKVMLENETVGYARYDFFGEPIPVEKKPGDGPLYGKVIKKLATRSGPSPLYEDTGTYFVEGQYIKVLCRQYDEIESAWWVLCEIPYHGEIRTLWAWYTRLDSSTLPLESIPIGGDGE